MNSLEFIEHLINVETEQYLPDNYYSDVYEKYQYGECATLAQYLYLLNNKTGQKIEIKVEDDFSEDFPTHHYIYKSKEGLYYDINGEFSNIWDLIEESSLFEWYQIEDNLIQIKEINWFDNERFNTEFQSRLNIIREK